MSALRSADEKAAIEREIRIATKIAELAAPSDWEKKVRKELAAKNIRFGLAYDMDALRCEAELIVDWEDACPSIDNTLREKLSSWILGLCKAKDWTVTRAKMESAVRFDANESPEHIWKQYSNWLVLRAGCTRNAADDSLTLPNKTA